MSTGILHSHSFCLAVSSYCKYTEDSLDIQKKRPDMWLSGRFFVYKGEYYPPKLSYMRFSEGTPRSQSIFSTALLMGPGPHM